MTDWTNQNLSTAAGSGGVVGGALGADLTAASSIVVTDFVHFVSGSATINTISGGLSHPQEIFLVPKASSTWTLGTSGNIKPRGVQVVFDRPVHLVWDGSTAWREIGSTSLPANVKNYGAQGDGVTDDTTAFRAAILAATQATTVSGVTSDGTGPELLVPPGEYIISNDLPINTLTATNGGAYLNIRGVGHPIIRQTNAAKDIFYWSASGGLVGNYHNIVEGITFYGGRRHIATANAGNDGGVMLIRDCSFRNAADYAIYGADIINSKLTIDKCRFFNNAKIIYNQSHAATVSDCLLTNGVPTTPNDVAQIYNEVSSAISIGGFFGSPNLSSIALQRWIDNYGVAVTIDSSRFGGEGATLGIGLVWQYSAPNASNGFTYPTSVSITNCDISAGHVNANSGAINCRTNVPQNIVLRGNRHYDHGPYISNAAGLVFPTYFATFPSTYRWKIDVEPELKWFDENTDLAGAGAPIPLALLPYLTGFASSAKLYHSGRSPARSSTDGTDSTPVNTEFYIGEVFLDTRTVLTGISVLNGSVASGNLKVGLFHSSGSLIATSASTAMSGTNAYQRIPFTGRYTLGASGTYYLAVMVDNSTARIRTHTFGDFGASKATSQVYATGFTAITPPSTFTAGLSPIASLY